MTRINNFDQVKLVKHQYIKFVHVVFVHISHVAAQLNTDLQIKTKLENILRQAVKKWSSAFYFQLFKTTNDRFWVGDVKYLIHMFAHRTMLYSQLPRCLIMS